MAIDWPSRVQVTLTVNGPTPKPPALPITNLLTTIEPVRYQFLIVMWPGLAVVTAPLLGPAVGVTAAVVALVLVVPAPVVAAMVGESALPVAVSVTVQLEPVGRSLKVLVPSRDRVNVCVASTVWPSQVQVTLQ